MINVLVSMINQLCERETKEAIINGKDEKKALSRIYSRLVLGKGENSITIITSLKFQERVRMESLLLLLKLKEMFAIEWLRHGNHGEKDALKVYNSMVASIDFKKSSFIVRCYLLASLLRFAESALPLLTTKVNSFDNQVRRNCQKQ